LIPGAGTRRILAAGTGANPRRCVGSSEPMRRKALITDVYGFK